MALTREEWLSELEVLLECASGVLGFEQPLAEVPNWDSVNIIGFIALVDEKADKVLEPEMILSCTTVGELIALASKG